MHASSQPRVLYSLPLRLNEMPAGCCRWLRPWCPISLHTVRAQMCCTHKHPGGNTGMCVTICDAQMSAASRRQGGPRKLTQPRCCSEGDLRVCQQAQPRGATNYALGPPWQLAPALPATQRTPAKRDPEGHLSQECHHRLSCQHVTDQKPTQPGAHTHPSHTLQSLWQRRTQIWSRKTSKSTRLPCTQKIMSLGCTPTNALPHSHVVVLQH